MSSAAYLLFYRRRSSRPLGPPELQELVLKARNPETVSDTEDSSGEGKRLGDNSSVSSRLLGSSNAGAVEAGAAITGTLQQGVNADGSGRGANQAVRLRNDVDDDEGISLNDDLYDEPNTTAAQLANEGPTWGFGSLLDDNDDDDGTYINTPADTASDRPNPGSDDEDRFADFADEENDQDMPDMYGEVPEYQHEHAGPNYPIVIEGQSPPHVVTTVEEDEEARED